MKTKLTFLLSLTFLFLFSGSAYGGVIDETFDGVFDRKDGVKGILCMEWNGYYLVNMKEKTIKTYKTKNAYDEKTRQLISTYKIIRETEIYIVSRQLNVYRLS